MNDQLDITKVKAGMQIKYIGDSLAYGGNYLVHTVESTYRNLDDCPEEDRGKLLIIEFMNDDIPMFIKLERLDLKEWILVDQ